MERIIKVNAESGYHYKSVPTLKLKGDYLKTFGFDIDTKVSVKLDSEQIIITPIKEEVDINI
ncbi:MAG: type I toxin-antitoxin system SymE family toxin [Clostridia bacterium]|nr:type I toxin-antitoxin system SymE family toxin [Clostridia bacterium]